MKGTQQLGSPPPSIALIHTCNRCIERRKLKEERERVSNDHVVEEEDEEALFWLSGFLDSEVEEEERRDRGGWCGELSENAGLGIGLDRER